MVGQQIGLGLSKYSTQKIIKWKDLDPVVKKWFECWDTGNLVELPITNDFKHTSPYGTISSKSKYLDIVNKNKKDFLGNKLTVIKHIREGENVCIQFEQKNANTKLEMTACEWYILEGESIKQNCFSKLYMK